jgi:hypothetical protein
LSPPTFLIERYYLFRLFGSSGWYQRKVHADAALIWAIKVKKAAKKTNASFISFFILYIPPFSLIFI